MTDQPSVGEKPKGPRYKHIEWLWSQTWDLYNGGDVWEYYFNLSEDHIARYRNDLDANNAQAVADFSDAEAHDQAQRLFFVATQKRREDQRELLRTVWRNQLSTLVEQAQFVLKSLALANGSAVLGTLAYLGRDNGGAPQWPLVIVIISGAAGFMLALLAAHVGVMRGMKPTGLLADMSALAVSLTDMAAKGAEIQQRTRRTFRITAAIGYLSAFCLVLSIAFGTFGLLQGGVIESENPTRVSHPQTTVETNEASKPLK